MKKRPIKAAFIDHGIYPGIIEINPKAILTIEIIPTNQKDPFTFIKLFIKILKISESQNSANKNQIAPIAGMI